MPVRLRKATARINGKGATDTGQSVHFLKNPLP
jgi:hypothetical protein